MKKEQAINLLDNLIGMVEDNQENDYDTAFRMAIDALRQPEKIMHWEQKVIHSEFKREQLEETVIYICDRCGQRSEKETNFCPNCGAKADWFCGNERKING